MDRIVKHAPKRPRLALLAGAGLLSLLGLAATAGALWLSPSRPAQAQTPVPLAPPACQCTVSELKIGGSSYTPISNCQCGTLQCVAYGSSQLQCLK